MTAREAFEFALVELNKVEAPSLLLEDYNYFINKAVYHYINKTYNQYDGNQQKTDDLRVLKASTFLNIEKSAGLDPSEDLFKVVLPPDYFHMLNCIVYFKIIKNYKCFDAGGRPARFGAKRLTADMYGQIINNHYMRPMYKRPYYFINNEIAYTGSLSEGDKSEVTMEIIYGEIHNVFEAQQVRIDYLKTPKNIRLTQDQIDRDDDSSQTLEFPDYVCQEIINELVKLLMENSSDPRLQSNIPINQTIAPPPQMQQQQGRG